MQYIATRTMPPYEAGHIFNQDDFPSEERLSALLELRYIRHTGGNPLDVKADDLAKMSVRLLRETCSKITDLDVLHEALAYESRPSACVVLERRIRAIEKVKGS